MRGKILARAGSALIVIACAVGSLSAQPAPEEVAVEREAMARQGLELQGRYVEVETSGFFSSLDTTDPAKVATALERCDQVRVGVKDVAMANGQPFVLTQQMMAGDLLIFGIPDGENPPMLMILDKDEGTLLPFSMLKSYQRLAAGGNKSAILLRYHQRDLTPGSGQTLNLAEVELDGAKVRMFETYFTRSGGEATERRRYAACPM